MNILKLKIFIIIPHFPYIFKIIAEKFIDINNKYGRGSLAFLSTGQIPLEEMAILGYIGRFGLGMEEDGNTRLYMVTAAVSYNQSFGFNPWAKLSWWIGLISVIALLPIIIIRGIRLGFENKYKIIIPVVVAPVNLLLDGYLSGIFEVNQTVACLLAIAAFTFPLTITGIAATRFGKSYHSFSFIAWIEIIITIISVLYTIYRFSEFYFFKKD